MAIDAQTVPSLSTLVLHADSGPSKRVLVLSALAAINSLCELDGNRVNNMTAGPELLTRLIAAASSGKAEEREGEERKALRRIGVELRRAREGGIGGLDSEESWDKREVECCLRELWGKHRESLGAVGAVLDWGPILGPKRGRTDRLGAGGEEVDDDERVLGKDEAVKLAAASIAKRDEKIKWIFGGESFLFFFLPLSNPDSFNLINYPCPDDFQTRNTNPDYDSDPPAPPNRLSKRHLHHARSKSAFQPLVSPSSSVNLVSPHCSPPISFPSSYRLARSKSVNTPSTPVPSNILFVSDMHTRSQSTDSTTTTCLSYSYSGSNLSHSQSPLLTRGETEELEWTVPFRPDAPFSDLDAVPSSRIPVGPGLGLGRSKSVMHSSKGVEVGEHEALRRERSRNAPLADSVESNPNANTLSQEERRDLVWRSRKLQKILGEPLPFSSPLEEKLNSKEALIGGGGKKSGMTRPRFSIAINKVGGALLAKRRISYPSFDIGTETISENDLEFEGAGTGTRRIELPTPLLGIERRKYSNTSTLPGSPTTMVRSASSPSLLCFPEFSLRSPPPPPPVNKDESYHSQLELHPPASPMSFSSHLVATGNGRSLASSTSTAETELGSSTTPTNSSFPSSPNPKEERRKKLAKLERLLGERVPPELALNTRRSTPTPTPTPSRGGSITSLSSTGSGGGSGGMKSKIREIWKGAIRAGLGVKKGTFSSEGEGEEVEEVGMAQTERTRPKQFARNRIGGGVEVVQSNQVGAIQGMTKARKLEQVRFFLGWWRCYRAPPFLSFFPLFFPARSLTSLDLICSIRFSETSHPSLFISPARPRPLTTNPPSQPQQRARSQFQPTPTQSPVPVLPHPTEVPLRVFGTSWIRIQRLSIVSRANMRVGSWRRRRRGRRAMGRRGRRQKGR